MKQRVVDHIADYFDEAGIEHYFGYIGGSLWPLLDGLKDCDATPVQAKHEAQAAHMADGYYRASGNIAPVLATKGPGALNAVPGIANLIHDSTATTVLLGGVPTQHTDKGAFESLYYHKQEGIGDLYGEITKQTWDCNRPDTTIDFLDRAMKKAVEGRPGPTAVHLPYDIQSSEVDVELPDPTETSADTRAKASGESLNRAADLISSVDRPLIVAGGGIRLSGGEQDLMDFVEAYQIPFVTSHMAKGSFPENHPLCLGPVGRSGWNCAAKATRNADVVLAIGCRFSDTHTVGYRRGIIYNIPPTKVIHVDIDPDEIGRNVPVEVGIMSDARSFIRQFHRRLEDSVDTLGSDEWREEIGGWKEEWWEYVESDTQQTGSPVHPHRLVYDTNQVMAPEDMLFIDIGDIIQYAEPFTTVEEPDTYFFNGGMLQMGWAAGAALGAKLARPDREAVVLMGDGAFMMCPYVVATAVEYDLPVTWIVLNNYGPNLERKATDRIFGESHPWAEFRTVDGELYNPDFVAMARSQGAEGQVLTENEDISDVVSEAIASDKPYLIDAHVDREAPSWFTEGIQRDYPTSWTEPADYL